MDSVPEQALCAFERATGLRISVHDHDGYFARSLPLGRIGHQNSICKAAKLNRNAACRAFDLHEVAMALARSPEPQVKLCHAGIIEWIAPVLLGDRKTATLFAGQRVGAAPDGALLQARLPGQTPRLPTVSAADSRWYLELLAQLAARLSDWVGTQATLPHHSNREGIIRRFVDERHTHGDGLPQLAQRLGLSAPRTTHLVRELCGTSLRALLDDARMTSALRLLQDSDLPVSGVAKASGYADVAHFHRRFRRLHGCTPAAWRAQAGRSSDA